MPPSSSSGDTSLVLDLTGKIVRDNQYASASGGFASVFTGTWDQGNKIHKVCILFIVISRNKMMERQDRQVAIKVLHVQGDDEHDRKRNVRGRGLLDVEDTDGYGSVPKMLGNGLHGRRHGSAAL